MLTLQQLTEIERTGPKKTPALLRHLQGVVSEKMQRGDLSLFAVRDTPYQVIVYYTHARGRNPYAVLRRGECVHTGVGDGKGPALLRALEWIITHGDNHD